MRLGPGKHLKGLSVFHGLAKPEEVEFILSYMDHDSIDPLPSVRLPRGMWMSLCAFSHVLKASGQPIITRGMI
jgi:hypothetical protein